MFRYERMLGVQGGKYNGFGLKRVISANLSFYFHFKSDDIVA